MKINKYINISAFFIVILFSAFILTSCNNINNDNSNIKEDISYDNLDDNENLQDKKDDEINNNDNQNGDDNGEVDTADSLKNDINHVINNMSLKERIGQLFFIEIRTDTNGNPLHSLDNSTKEVLREYKPGGVILFSENINNINQVIDLNRQIKELISIPPFIAVDEEGGRVSRIFSNEKMSPYKIPPMSEVGKTNNPEIALKLSKHMAQFLKSLGFNMNFAPVADIFTNIDNKVIGDRSFGNEPELVASMVSNMVEGMQSEGISSVIKHFPGHGDTLYDSHNDQIIVEHNLERLNNVEFIPFIKGIENGTDGIMTAHIRLDNISDSNHPATLSEVVLNDILRKELDFNGIIITDSLQMGAITRYYNSSEVCVLALQAGADMLLIPLSFIESFEAVFNAVSEGIITEERINESVYRIIKVKLKRGLFKNTTRTDISPFHFNELKELLNEIQEIINTN